jgi:hypothetical protein
MAFDLGDYVDVPTRMAELRDKYPDARLQPLDPTHPYRIETIGTQTFVVYVAACYRTADDSTPGVGTAWEVVPGLTPYTKGSEIQNAETSAWGRAIVASLIADTKKGISSAEDVRNRREEQSDPFVPAQRVQRMPPPLVDKAKRDQIRDLIAADPDEAEIKETWKGAGLPALAKLTVDRLPEALEFLGTVGIVVDELPAQTALVGCPSCDAAITTANPFTSWPDPAWEGEDPAPMVAGCESCKVF